MMLLFFILGFLLLASPSWAAVVFDNKASVTGTSVTTLTTVAFTITSSANRAGTVAICTRNASTSGFTSGIGGTAGAFITGTEGTLSTAHLLLHGVTAPPSGSQTATASWTTAANAGIGALTASGVNQTTPLTNGTFTTSSVSPTSLSVTSTSGDLTMTGLCINNAGVDPTTNQTIEYLDEIVSSLTSAGDIGPGTGTTTHTWTSITNSKVISGANFLAAGGAPPAASPMRTLMGVGQ